MAGYTHKGPNRNECHHHRSGPNIPSTKTVDIAYEVTRFLMERYPSGILWTDSEVNTVRSIIDHYISEK